MTAGVCPTCGRQEPSHALASDVDVVANAAHNLVLSIRDLEPREVMRQVVGLCLRRPGWMAQIVLTLAAWVNPEESLNRRGERVEAISRWRAAS